MKTICPICGFEMEVEDKKIQKRGRNVTCPNCAHTFFVERSTYPDIEIIDDSAGHDIIPKVRPTVKRDRQHEEKKPAQVKGRSDKDDTDEEAKKLFVAVTLGILGIILLLCDDIPIGIISIAGAIFLFLSSDMWKGKS